MKKVASSCLIVPSSVTSNSVVDKGHHLSWTDVGVNDLLMGVSRNIVYVPQPRLMRFPATPNVSPSQREKKMEGRLMWEGLFVFYMNCIESEMHWIEHEMFQ